MKGSKRYYLTFFPPQVIKQGFEVLVAYLNSNPQFATSPGKEKPDYTIGYMNLLLEKGPETWHYDTEEDFFHDYRKDPYRAFFQKRIGPCGLDVHYHNKGTDITIECRSRGAIISVFEAFDSLESSSKIILPPTVSENPKPQIFIGHGHDGQWRNLKDHLTDKHDYQVIAYEVGARAGHSIRDILEEMLGRSSIAFLVLTGEDIDAKGNLHPRENVIHEAGLFQGRLGFARGIILLEEGTAEFSNIHGIEQLRFSNGNIKEVFGDVVAVIKREFGA